jgi:hypothetical protein
MPRERLHRFTRADRRFAIDVDTCFCFECDDITWDLLEHYPHEPANRIYHVLGAKHDRSILAEVIGELEWLRATNSILPVSRRAMDERWLMIERGLKKLTVDLRGDAVAALANLDNAISLLIGRSQKQQQLELEFIVGANTPSAAHGPIAEAQASAARIARLTDKSLTVTLHSFDVAIADRSNDIAPHRISLRVPLNGDEASKRLASVFALTRKAQKLAACAKAIRGENAAETGAIILHLTDAKFAAAVQAIHAAGFPSIELDLDSIFIRPPNLRAFNGRPHRPILPQGSPKPPRTTWTAFAGTTTSASNRWRLSFSRFTAANRRPAATMPVRLRSRSRRRALSFRRSRCRPSPPFAPARSPPENLTKPCSASSTMSARTRLPRVGAAGRATCAGRHGRGAPRAYRLDPHTGGRLVRDATFEHRNRRQRIQ